MQLNDAISSLYHALLQYGIVSVKGVGTFLLSRQSAEFVQSGTVLTPPSTRLFFSFKEEKARALHAHLIESGIAPERAKELELILQEYADARRMANEAELLPGFGPLREGELAPAHPEWFNVFEGLLAVDVPPGSSSGSQSGSVGIKEIKTPIQKEDGLSRLQFWSAVAVVLVFVGLALFFMPHAPENTNPVTPKHKLHKTVSGDSLTGFSNGKAQPEKPSQAKIAANPASPSQQCTVIVGAFRQGSNAEKMKQRIKSQGYILFEQEFEGMKRVGIVLECNPDHPDVARTAIREKFDKDAWYLRGN